jgi:hypothetical protein
MAMRRLNPLNRAGTSASNNLASEDEAPDQYADPLQKDWNQVAAKRLRLGRNTIRPLRQGKTSSATRR